MEAKNWGQNSPPDELLAVLLGVVAHFEQLGDELAHPGQQEEQTGHEREAVRLREPRLGDVVVVQVSGTGHASSPGVERSETIPEVA